MYETFISKRQNVTLYERQKKKRSGEKITGVAECVAKEKSTRERNSHYIELVNIGDTFFGLDFAMKKVPTRV